MALLLVLLLASTATAATLDERIASLQAESDSLQREVWTLESQLLAATLDTLARTDAALRANDVRVVRATASPEWVRVALDKLSAMDLRIVKAEIKGAGLDFQLVGPDTLYMRGDRAARALPVISAALDLQ